MDAVRRARDVLLLMMDTRPARLASPPEHPQLAFELNRRYACAHGYDLLYLRMLNATCVHEEYGERHASYCKLAAVAEALSRGYSWVIWLDSDAFFRNVSMPLPLLLSQYGDRTTTGANGSNVTVVGAPGAWRGADVSFAWDRPYSYGPNAGVQIWRNSASARQLLALWWHIPGRAHERVHDYEQHALQWRLLHLRTFGQLSGRIHTLGLMPFPSAIDARGWPAFLHPVAHVDHGRHFYRSLLMSMALLGEDDLVPARPHGAHRAQPAGAARLGTAKLRARLLRAAVRVVRKQLRKEGTNNGSRCRAHVESFDPSAQAAAHMSPRRPAVSAEAAAAEPPHSSFLPIADVLHGMPLQLANCTAAGAESHLWQRWRLGGKRLALVPPDGAPTSGGRFCLRIGPARAPRQPDFPLAQLAPCLASATEFEGVNSAAGLQSLSFNGSTGRIRLGSSLEVLSSVASASLDSASPSLWTRHASASLLAKAAWNMLGDAALTRSLLPPSADAASLGARQRRHNSSKQVPGPHQSPDQDRGRRLSAALGTAEPPAPQPRELAPALASLFRWAGLAFGESDSGVSVEQQGALQGGSRQRELAPPLKRLLARLGLARGPARAVTTAAAATAPPAPRLGSGDGPRPGRGPGSAPGAWPTRCEPVRGAAGRGRGDMRGGAAGGAGRGRGRGRGCWTQAQIEQFRRRRESRMRRRAPSLGQPCTSAYQKPHKFDDKTYEDCEDWCDDSKINHCRYCKCRGCKYCHGDIALPDWALQMPTSAQCAAFGLCLNTSTHPLCLSVWRGEFADGAPLVWSRCRSDIFLHQTWSARSAGAGGAVFIELTPSLTSAPSPQPLCLSVSVPSPRFLS